MRVSCELRYSFQRLMVAPGAGTEDGIPPGVTKVGYVPVLKPLLRLFDDPAVAFPLLIPVVPVPVERPTLLEPTAPPVPPPSAPPAPCASAMDEVTARTEAKAIIVSFIVVFPATLTSKGRPRQVGRVSRGRPWGRAVGGAGTNPMWVCDPPPPINSALQVACFESAPQYRLVHPDEEEMRSVVNPTRPGRRRARPFISKNANNG